MFPGNSNLLRENFSIKNYKEGTLKDLGCSFEHINRQIIVRVKWKKSCIGRKFCLQLWRMVRVSYLTRMSFAGNLLHLYSRQLRLLYQVFFFISLRSYFPSSVFFFDVYRIKNSNRHRHRHRHGQLSKSLFIYYSGYLVHYFSKNLSYFHAIYETIKYRISFSSLIFSST